MRTESLGMTVLRLELHTESKLEEHLRGGHLNPAQLSFLQVILNSRNYSQETGDVEFVAISARQRTPLNQLQGTVGLLFVHSLVEKLNNVRVLEPRKCMGVAEETIGDRKSVV